MGECATDILCSRNYSEIPLLVHFRNIAKMLVILTNNSHQRRPILHQLINCSWWTLTRQSLWASPFLIQSLFSMCSCPLGKNVRHYIYIIKPFSVDLLYILRVRVHIPLFSDDLNFILIGVLLHIINVARYKILFYLKRNNLFHGQKLVVKAFFGSTQAVSNCMEYILFMPWLNFRHSQFTTAALHYIP